MFVHKYMNFNWVNTHNRYWSFRYKFIQSRCKQFHVLGLRNEGYLSKTWLVFTRKLYLKRTKLLCDFTAWVGIKTTEWECLLIQESVGRVFKMSFLIPLLCKNLRWLLFSYKHATNKGNRHTYQFGISYNNWIRLFK